MRPSRWVPARFTRRSGSCAFSVPKRAALVTIISVSPMMALSGVRSSWLMLARNCDLCSLAICELAALLLDLAEQPRVLDRQHRLRGERLQQLDRALRELARRLAAHHQRSHDLIGGEQRHHQPGAIAETHDQFVGPRGRLQIGDLIGLSFAGSQRGRLRRSRRGAP